jgi:predicted PurR-regulated permease PerM
MTTEPALPLCETEILTPVASVGRSVALTVLAVFAVFYTLYFAATLFVPIAAAVLLSMLLAPPVQFLERLRVPSMAASAFVVLATVGCIAAGLAALAGPAQIWIEKGPESLKKMEHRFFPFRKPLASIQKATEQLQGTTDPKARAAGPQEVRVMQPALTDIVLSGTPQAVASILSMTILVYFLLASGDVFPRKLVTVTPSFHDKKRAVEITRRIETDISFWLLNFTLVNVGLGAAMAMVAALLGIPNPLLWGALFSISCPMSERSSAWQFSPWWACRPSTACRLRWPRREFC